MTLSVIYTRAALGVCAPLITVEVHISNGLPGLTMVVTGDNGEGSPGSRT
jgi:magnesium chelatase family protein